MNYYVTGANGFIGSHLCHYLNQRGDFVVKHDRFNGGFDNMIGADAIIHLHSYGNHYSQNDNALIVRENILFFIDLVNKAVEKGVKAIYNVSSSSVHLKNQTVYSASKMASEAILIHHQLLFDSAVNVRPYSIFGEGESEHRFIPTVIRCLNSGDKMNLVFEPRHDWIHVSSFIDLMMLGETECGSGYSYSNIEVVKMLEEISGKTLNYNRVDSMRSYDCEDWVCPKVNKLKIDLFESLKQTYERTI